MDLKSDLFFERLLEAVWGHLGRLLGCLGALLGGLVFRNIPKMNSKCMFTKSFIIAILALLDRFRGPYWLILARFGSQNGGNELLKIGPTSGWFFLNGSLLLRVLMAVKEGSTARAPNRWAGTCSWAPGAQVLVVVGFFSFFSLGKLRFLNTEWIN